MKKVCIFGFPRMENFHGYSIDSLDPAPYFPSVSRQMLFQKLSEAKSLDQMYRDKDPSYMRFLGDFVDKFRDADLLVAYIYNPVHTEVLCKKLQYVPDCIYTPPTGQRRGIYRQRRRENACKRDLCRGTSGRVILPRTAFEKAFADSRMGSKERGRGYQWNSHGSFPCVENRKCRLSSWGVGLPRHYFTASRFRLISCPCSLSM